MTEEWRDIPSTPGYQASSLGRVRSVDRELSNGRGTYIRRGVVLRPFPVKDTPYLQVAVASVRRSVHHLVLEAFVGPAGPGEECRHLDGNGANNVPANLRWGTKSQNTEDQVRMGTHVQARKTHCPKGHPYDEKNTARSRSGSRRCRECRRAAWRSWNQKKTNQAKESSAA